MNGENPDTRAKMEKIQARIRESARVNGIDMDEAETRRNLAFHANSHDETADRRPQDDRSTEEALNEAKKKMGAEKTINFRARIDPDASRWI